MCFKKLRDKVKLLFTITWMSVMIYALLMKLQDVQLTNSGVMTRTRIQSDNLLFLKHLGFDGEPKLYPQAYHYIEESQWPVFALALHSENMQHFIDFLISFRKYFFNHKLVIFAVNLSKAQKQLAVERCYCQVRDVQWPLYPSHVQNLKYQAYLTLLIQETLQEFGSVFWCDVAMRFTNSSVKPVLSSQALESGFVVWPQDGFPTSAFTYPNLYKHFHTNQSQYYFHQMVSPIPGLYFNTEKLHNGVMKPWVMCVLNQQCLSPKGAQSRGCTYKAKPKYKYAGCHRYAVSAFNVILGQAYEHEQSYLAKQEIFKIVPQRSLSVIEIIKNLTVSILF